MNTIHFVENFEMAIKKKKIVINDFQIFFFLNVVIVLLTLYSEFLRFKIKNNPFVT